MEEQNNQALLVSNRPEVPAPALTIAKQLSEPVDFVSAVLIGWQSPIKSQNLESIENLLLLVVIPEIGMAYGARKEIHESVLAEMVDLVVSEFSHLGLSEIRQAYRLWASGKMEVGGAAEMWGGEINARQMAAVLTAYSRHRQRVINQHLNNTHADNQKILEEKLAQHKRESFEYRFPRMIEEAREKRIEWHQVPEFWYQSAKNRDMLQFTIEEAHELYQEALEISRKERAENPEKNIKPMNGFQPSTIEGRARVIARQLMVWRKLINVNH